MRFCLIVTALLSGSVLAATPELGRLTKFKPLSDTELAAMSGKYTVSGRDYYFGLEMQTSFLQSDGLIRHVQMQVELNVSDSPSVVVRVDEPTTSTGEELALTTLGQASGLQQRIQISGDRNYGLNDLNMLQGRLTPDGTEIGLGQTRESTDGQITYSSVPDTLGYSATLPSGRAEQGLLKQNGNALLLQNIHIDGAYHDVSNRALIRYEGIRPGITEGQLLRRQLPDFRGIGL